MNKTNGFFTTTNRSNSTVGFKSFYANKEKLSQAEKQDKLKTLLIMKFMKKYQLKVLEPKIEEDIVKFVLGDKHEEKDLKELEGRIKVYVSEKLFSQLNPSNSLKSSMHGVKKTLSMGNLKSLNPIPNNYGYPISTKSEKEIIPMNFLETSHGNTVNEIASPKNNQAINVATSNKNLYGSESIKSDNDNNNKDKNEDNEIDDDIKLNSSDELDDKNERLEINGGYDWGTIMAYYQQKYIEDKRNDKLRDIELKKKIRLELETQMKEKQNKQKEVIKDDIDYANSINLMVSNLNNLDKQKELEIKERIMNNKIKRDNQVKDEKNKKSQEMFIEKQEAKETSKII